MVKVIQPDGSVLEDVLDSVVGRRQVEYPSILPIPFDSELQSADDHYYGPEDPRIVLRTNSMGFEEPLIVFNMKSNKLVQRVMHIYLPFSTHLRVLTKRNTPFTQVEKNWTPFISGRSNEAIDFVYSLDPLEVMSCNIESGICDWHQKPSGGRVGQLRGGTQLVELLLSKHFPELALPEHRKVYIGMARAHLNGCGCGESMYRPNFMILIDDYNPGKDKHYFKVSHVSEYIDFFAEVGPWVIPELDGDGKLKPINKGVCVGRNVLIPNSIAYWGIESVEKDGKVYKANEFDLVPQNDSPVKFNDYMAITLSSADRDVSVVHVRGLLSYIMKLPLIFDSESQVYTDAKFQPRGFDLNIKCAMSASDKYCKNFGNVLREKEKAEKEKAEKEKAEKKN